MTVRSTTQAGDKIIHKKSSAVSDVQTNEVQGVVQDLVDTMRETGLVGMAAPQIGKNVRIFVTEIRETEVRKKGTDPLRVFINPEIMQFSEEKNLLWEGCISNDEELCLVERPQQVAVKF